MWGATLASKGVDFFCYWGLACNIRQIKPRCLRRDSSGNYKRWIIWIIVTLSIIVYFKAQRGLVWKDGL